MYKLSCSTESSLTCFVLDVRSNSTASEQCCAPCTISQSPGAARLKRAELTCQKVVAMKTSLGTYVEGYLESYLYCRRRNPTFYFSCPHYVLCCKHLQVSSEKRQIFKEINTCCVLQFESATNTEWKHQNVYVLRFLELNFLIFLLLYMGCSCFP